MLKLSKKTEYSILALQHISRQTGKSANVKEMARELNISQSLLAKLFQELARKKIVGSVQGAHGGYTLLMDLAQLSLMDLVEMIDGPVSLAPCHKPEHTCDRLAGCGLRKSIAPIEIKVRTLLHNVKVADL
jgi:Rrf2 family protein